VVGVCFPLTALRQLVNKALGGNPSTSSLARTLQQITVDDTQDELAENTFGK
jgi:hypothetical protein